VENMGWEQILIYLIILAIVFGFAMSFLAYAGFDIADIIRAIAGARRRKLDINPRDHFERFVEGHKRSARDNKPKYMKYLWVTGDSSTPMKRIGKIVGYEKHKHSNLFFIKTRPLSWSVCMVIPDDYISDANRRNVWVKARGFTSETIVRIPIPTEDVKDIHEFNHKAFSDLRYLIERQCGMDVFENMAWSIDQAMGPPVKSLVMASEAIQPQVSDKDYISEDKTAGGKPE
jgi:hypothetical protein